VSEAVAPVQDIPICQAEKYVTEKVDLAPRFCDLSTDLELHIHHPDASKRDLPSSPRYLLFHAIGRQVVCESDNWLQVLRAIETARIQTEPAHMVDIDALNRHKTPENEGSDVCVIPVYELDA
tara:strand:+ start:163 stop:531 length:369 start_codon:yes stop_codon:yes gene_type:complete